MRRLGLRWMGPLVFTLTAQLGCGGAGHQAAQASGGEGSPPASVEPGAVCSVELRLVADEGGQSTESWCGGQPEPLAEEVVVSADQVAAVRRAEGLEGPPALVLELTTLGRDRLAEVTAANVGRRLAVVVDGRVVHAPVIREAITGGVAQLTTCDGLSIEQLERLLACGGEQASSD